MAGTVVLSMVKSFQVASGDAQILSKDMLKLNHGNDRKETRCNDNHYLDW